LATTEAIMATSPIWRQDMPFDDYSVCLLSFCYEAMGLLHDDKISRSVRKVKNIFGNTIFKYVGPLDLHNNGPTSARKFETSVGT
jgi:hypothetical protein